MSSNAGGDPKVFRVRFTTPDGVIETLVRKRHLTENIIPRDKNGIRFITDFYGNTIYFTAWTSMDIVLPDLRIKNKYGGYSNG
jgi:hypothetical protein